MYPTKTMSHCHEIKLNFYRYKYIGLGLGLITSARADGFLLLKNL